MRTADPDGLDRARRRFARRQWSRRWLLWRRVLGGLVVAGLLGAGGWLVFSSPVFAVAGVRVEGTGVLDPRTVRRVAAVPAGTPLATVDLEAVARRVRTLTPVLAVDVSRAWPDRVRIDVTEREAVAVVDEGGRLKGVDAAGVEFRDYPARPADLPLLRRGPGAGPDALAEAAAVSGALPAGLAARVDHVYVASVDAISLRLRSGRTVLWGSAEQSRSKARVLAVLLDQQARLYDVSVPGRPSLRR